MTLFGSFDPSVGDDVDPVTLTVGADVLDDLRTRLRATRLPSPETVGDWSQGVPLTQATEMIDYWRDTYDWRRFEKTLNSLGIFQTTIDDVSIRFVHARSRHENALPLVLTHGWPGSIREFTDLVGLLTNPADPADAFHVVIPSLPGYGLSGTPHNPGWGAEKIADTWKVLMGRLGYGRYGAHGGDWGSVVTSHLATIDAEHMVGIHLTIPMVDLDAKQDDDVTLSPFEHAGMKRAELFGATGMGYFHQQMTAPQTLGYGLADSPIAQLTWILDKLYNWSDCHGALQTAIGRDAALDNVMLYWLSNTGASSARLYWESCAAMPEDIVAIPVGCSIFPLEHVRVPRAKTAGRLLNVVYWNELEAGGHFPGLELPGVLAGELTEFFARVR